MKNDNLKFCISKYSYKKDEDFDLSFLPMLTRRKLSPLCKVAFATMYECFENENINLVFASRYGEFEKLLKLISQYSENNEVSPITFSTSVHNSAISAFSLLNKIKNPYYSISAGEYSFQTGLLDGILNSKEKDTLYCYSDENESFSCLIKKNFDLNTIQLISTPTKTPNSIKEFCDFLENKKNEFIGYNYILTNN